MQISFGYLNMNQIDRDTFTSKMHTTPITGFQNGEAETVLFLYIRVSITILICGSSILKATIIIKLPTMYTKMLDLPNEERAMVILAHIHYILNKFGKIKCGS